MKHIVVWSESNGGINLTSGVGVKTAGFKDEKMRDDFADAKVLAGIPVMLYTHEATLSLSKTITRTTEV